EDSTRPVLTCGQAALGGRAATGSSPSGISNSTGTRTRLATGLPSSIFGSNFHLEAASTATWSNTPAGWELSTATSTGLPPASTSITSTTLPVTFCSTADFG